MGDNILSILNTKIPSFFENEIYNHNYNED